MNVTELLKELAKIKRSQAPLWNHLDQVGHAKKDKVRDCGSWLHLREWLEHDGRCTVTNANFCKTHVLCHMCAIRRTSKLVASYHAKVEHVLGGRSDLVPVMITWTVRNGDDLRERFDHLRNARLKLGKQARNQLARKNPPAVMNELTALAGGVYHFEFKRGKGGKWHPHIHEFALLHRYIDQGKLSREWEQMTGDSKVVGVTECKGGILKGLLEVLKYATKFSEMTPADVVEIHDTVKGARLLSNYGVLRGISAGDIDSDEPLDGAYRDYVAMWLHGRRGYDLRPYSDCHGDPRNEWRLSDPNRFDPQKPWTGMQRSPGVAEGHPAEPDRIPSESEP